ncbi:unnamed protein product [Rhizophagus irregularis]|uniref:Uncharacterized protein n=1 Tax=Rhizophagus irregularis TaxID=588596 RepID=A0A915ZV06_9GLOM|nr:unnamed protein product [Rhizophagus irregularis]
MVQDIKHVEVCGSSANFFGSALHKKLSCKITQNKEIHYTMTDNNAIEITLNCLIVPVGNLIGVPCSEVNQAITIRTNRPHF